MMTGSDPIDKVSSWQQLNILVSSATPLSPTYASISLTIMPKGLLSLSWHKAKYPTPGIAALGRVAGASYFLLKFIHGWY